MRVTIELVERLNGLTKVICRHNIGRIQGIWKSKTIPQLGEKYNVEISLPLLNTNDICVLNKNRFFYSTTVDKDGQTFFRGKCEFIDDDDVYIIRFFSDWIQMLEIQSGNIKIDDIIQFSVDNEKIEIYPYF